METDELEKVLKIMRFKNNQIKYILCFINSPVNIQELYQKKNKKTMLFIVFFNIF